MSAATGFLFFEGAGSPLVKVPQHLDPIGHSDQWIIGSLLLVAFIVIAFSKRVEEHSLMNAVRVFFSLGTVSSLQKIGMRLSTAGPVLLSINFVLSLWVCLILFVEALSDEINGLILFWTAFAAIVFVVYQLVGLFLIAWITGEYSRVKVPVLQTLGGFPFGGMLFFGLALVWFLNPVIGSEMFFIFSYVFLGFWVLRTMKGLIGGVRVGISWYYIILYFCTLEILPLFVTYYYVEQNFKV